MTDVMLSFAGEQIAKSIEEQIHETDMWDVPATLWDITAEDLPDGLPEFVMSHKEEIPPAAVTRRAMHSDDPEFMDAVMGSEGGYCLGMAFCPEIAHYLEGHPYDAMKGLQAGPEVLGACLVTEGWDYSAPAKERFKAGEQVGFSPSEDPDRREIRMVQVCWRDGTEALVQRWRDTDEVETFIDNGEDSFHLGGRVVAALRRYLGRASKMEYDTSAYDSARLVWALGLIHSASEVMEGLLHAISEGRDIVDEMKGKLMEQGLPEDAVDAFVKHPTDGLVLVGIRSHPDSIIDRAPVPMAGLSVVFDDCPDLPDYESPEYKDYDRLLGGKGPEKGTPEDLALWDRARLAQIDMMESMFAGLEELFTAKGKREVAGLPAPLAKEKIQERLDFLRWADAGLWAMECDHQLPDTDWLINRMNQLVAEDVISEGTMELIITGAGLREDDE